MRAQDSPVTTVPTHAQAENAWAGQGPVILDIGDDVGALVVAMPAETVGREVEIRQLDPLWTDHAHPRLHDQGHDHGHEHGHEHLAHVAVVSRPVAGGQVPSLVFGELAAGRYELFEKGRPEAVAVRVTVVGGQVTCTVWPD